MKHKRPADNRTRRPIEPSGRDASLLGALAALGALSALAALFLWAQMVLARSGGTPFCAAVEDTGCGAAWDSAFASVVHRFTGLPPAGWGLVWGIVAFAFPLLALVRLAQRRSFLTLAWAVRWMAVVGVIVVSVMIAVSTVEQAFCPGCAVIDILVLGYAGLGLVKWREASLQEARRGFVLAAVASGGVFLLLLYPGLATLRGSEAERPEKADDLRGRTVSSPGTGDLERDRQIAEFVASLTPQLKQALSDSLYVYRNSPRLTLPSSRVSLDAPVRITAFTDVLCRRCAGLHATLRSLRQRLPPGSFGLEPRHYPLDTRCNPRVRVRHGHSARCLAAAAQICLETHEKAFEFSSALFENQSSLTEAKVYELAAPYLSQQNLERCIESSETRAKLADDVALAYRYEAEGPPLVLVNGRRGTSLEPFLHAVILTRGAAFHPAFEPLPEPHTKVHLH